MIELNMQFPSAATLPIVSVLLNSSALAIKS
jgi:hypothetical protein